MNGFGYGPLEDMVAVGAVSANRVKLWMRSHEPGTLTVAWWPEADPARRSERSVEVPAGGERDQTATATLPGDRSPDLEPLTRYGFRVTHPGNGRVVGEGRFETAPARPEATPSRFSFAVLSCHQPFDEHGAVRRESEQMLQAVRMCLDRHETKLVFLVGDQLYSDMPAAYSLFDDEYFRRIAPPGRDRLRECSAAEVRRIFQERYRHFWNLPGWKALQAEHACYPILDDHDIVDNWGSDPAHEEPDWQAIGRGARAACFDYQLSRVLPDAEGVPEGVPDGVPESFHYEVDYGYTSFLVMDLRSQRRAGAEGQLFAQSQRDALVAFLRRFASRHVLGIVLSVPVIHLPKHLVEVASRVTSSGEDFSDRWSSSAHRRDRDWFLETLQAHQKAHPEQHVLLLSGDIHIGCVHRIEWEGGGTTHQLVSSGVTHVTHPFINWGSRALIRLNREVVTDDGKLKGRVELLRGTSRRHENPYTSLNIGIVELEAPEPGAPPHVRFLLYGHHGEDPVCVFRSS